MYTYLYIDNLHSEGAERRDGELDGLSNSARSELASLPGDVFPGELRSASHPHMRPLRLHAAQTVARRSRQR